MAGFMGKARKLLSNAAGEIGEALSTRGARGYDEILEEGAEKVSRVSDDIAEKATSAGSKTKKYADDLAGASYEQRIATERGRAYNNASSQARKNMRSNRSIGDPAKLERLEADEIARGMDNYNANSNIGGQGGYRAQKQASNQALEQTADTTKQASNQAAQGRSGLLSSMKRHPVVTGTLAAGGVGGTSYLLGKNRGKRSNRDLYRM